MAEWAATFRATFSETETLTATFGEVIEVNHDYDPYRGPTVVIPKWADQVLLTNQKIMEDDVTVLTIPLETVENTSGGNTITIGG